MVLKHFQLGENSGENWECGDGAVQPCQSLLVLFRSVGLLGDTEEKQEGPKVHRAGIDEPAFCVSM